MSSRSRTFGVLPGRPRHLADHLRAVPAPADGPCSAGRDRLRADQLHDRQYRSARSRARVLTWACSLLHLMGVHTRPPLDALYMLVPVGIGGVHGRCSSSAFRTACRTRNWASRPQAPRSSLDRRVGRTAIFGAIFATYGSGTWPATPRISLPKGFTRSMSPRRCFHLPARGAPGFVSATPSWIPDRLPGASRSPRWPSWPPCSSRMWSSSGCLRPPARQRLRRRWQWRASRWPRGANAGGFPAQQTRRGPEVASSDTADPRYGPLSTSRELRAYVSRTGQYRSVRAVNPNGPS